MRTSRPSSASATTRATAAAAAAAAAAAVSAAASAAVSDSDDSEEEAPSEDDDGEVVCADADEAEGGLGLPRGASFVFTSNVDGYFRRSGWEESNILEIHGGRCRQS